MAVTKITIGDENYEVDGDKLTLGETWLLEREYGIQGDQPTASFGAYVGLLAIAMRRRDPKLSEAEAKAKVCALTDEQITITTEKPEEDPTPAGTERPAGEPKAGARAKTRKKPGSQS